MGFKQSFLLALKSIATSKMRSFLTMLGIIIGVGSVIILVSLMQGMTNSMTSTFESMGTNLINVNITGVDPRAPLTRRTFLILRRKTATALPPFRRQCRFPPR